MAQVRAMKMRNGIAGQRQYDVKVAYNGAPEMVWYTFVGSVYGAPGPVVLISGGMQTFVYNPARFGDVFGADWILSFFSK